MKKLAVVCLLIGLVVMAMGFRVIMVTDVGGLGDKSFNDGTWEGILIAAKEIGAEAQVIQSYEQADYIPNLTKAAQQADVVYAVGFMMTDALFKVARQFPNTYFVGIDIVPPEGVNLPNVLCFVFREEQAGFYAGYIAAAMTATGKIGFVGGIPIPPVERFRYGFEAGARIYSELHKKRIEILRGYTNDFEDPKKGKDLTLAQYAQGADIVFLAAGACGNGGIEAAREKMVSLVGSDKLVDIIDYVTKNKKGYFAIGVDVDQDYMAPGVVLCSATKGISAAGYYGVKWAWEGTFEGGLKVLGVKEGGAGVSPMKYTKGMIPNHVIAELEYLTKLIKEGKLVIPDTEDALKAFKVPPISFPF
ncbi:BMP family lipoprotein [Pseudothermotoga thermarum]|uniref:Nucleoside-binding protein n=1 Tax=Pseudothermotoga thermarum DSM 5069 TaxID=688269 RepID=F7YX95_9THEM|nr:BMP family ABC transporter substrate-binding protein [Pseudothermotoga thermarum]AEH51295.1 nucleoside-binding protein [Pseudothermotoga thermarum DSM 5069]